MRHGASGRPCSSRRRRTAYCRGSRSRQSQRSCKAPRLRGSSTPTAEIGAGQEQEARDDMDEIMRLVHLEDARFRDERIGDEADDPDQDKDEAEDFRQQVGVPMSLDHCEVPFGSVASRPPRDARRRARATFRMRPAASRDERSAARAARRSPGVFHGSCRVSWGGRRAVSNEFLLMFRAGLPWRANGCWPLAWP